MITVMMNLVIILYKDKEEKRLFFFFACFLVMGIQIHFHYMTASA